MAFLLIQELGRDWVREEIWRNQDPHVISKDMLESLSQLHAQLKVLSALQTTANLLRQHSSNKWLPNQQANRVKHMIKFVFEKTTSGNERQTRLRKLDCDSLKLCGLSYKKREILELPPAEFDFLVTKVPDFIHDQQLSQHLYREDINKAVNGEFDPEVDYLLEAFLQCSSSLPNAKLMG
jgi:hypothetical protein